MAESPSSLFSKSPKCCILLNASDGVVQHSVSQSLGHSKYRVKRPVWEPDLNGDLSHGSLALLRADAVAEAAAAKITNHAIGSYCEKAAVGTVKI